MLLTILFYLLSIPCPAILGFLHIDDMHLLTGWLAFVGISYAVVAIKSRRSRKQH
jgi:hypothetical protein